MAIDQYVESRKQEQIDRSNKRVAIYDLTGKQRIDVIEAYDILNGSASLKEAAEFYLLHNDPRGGARSVRELLDDYLRAKEKANRRPRTLSDIKTRIGRFAQDSGDIPVHMVTSHDLEKWLDHHDYRDVSRLNYRTAFVGFFNFALKRGYIRVNPALALERPVLDEKIPEILTVAEVGRLMRSAERYTPNLVPYLAIATWAGVRPAEIEQLDWRNINLSERVIVVDPQVAKKRRRRRVDISENLSQWLAPHRTERGRIPFSRADFDVVRAKAEIEWANDVLRHTYGSYHLAMHEDAANTALQMGHAQTDVLFNHYRELVPRADAERFWAIRPSELCSLIRLNA